MRIHAGPGGHFFSSDLGFENVIINPMKPNYAVIPMVTVLVAVLGGYITSGNMDWYRTLSLPSFTPPGQAIGAVWTMIFILATISALLVWNGPAGSRQAQTERNWIMGAFGLNGALNLGWSYLFFGQHLIGPAVLESAALGLSVVLLVSLVRPRSRLAAWLLAPYLIWVAFATYLTYAVLRLN